MSKLRLIDKNIKKIATLLLLLFLVLGAIAGCQIFKPAIEQSNQQLTISAAASLKDVLLEIMPMYRKLEDRNMIRHNFGGSGDLQQQIINGAPVDIFISAATKPMDQLQQQNLIVADTRRNFLGNRLILIVPIDQNQINNLSDLTHQNVQRIAIGDPRSVPVGQYTRQALIKLGIWESLQSKFVLANNVRQVSQFVGSANVQAGLVYATDYDPRTNPMVKVVQTIDRQLHEPIIYPIAVLRSSRHQINAKKYLEFLISKPVKAIFEKYGFDTL
jgi:molybdate transport system substrate-binding protein